MEKTLSEGVSPLEEERDSDFLEAKSVLEKSFEKFSKQKELKQD